MATRGLEARPCQLPSQGPALPPQAGYRTEFISESTIRIPAMLSKNIAGMADGMRVNTASTLSHLW